MNGGIIYWVYHPNVLTESFSDKRLHGDSWEKKMSYLNHLNHLSVIVFIVNCQASWRNFWNCSAYFSPGSWIFTTFCHNAGWFAMKNFTAFLIWLFCRSVHLLQFVFKASKRIAVKIEEKRDMKEMRNNWWWSCVTLRTTSGVPFPGGIGKFSLLCYVQTGSGPTQPAFTPMIYVPGKVKRPESEADISSVSSAETMNVWR